MAVKTITAARNQAHADQVADSVAAKGAEKGAKAVSFRDWAMKVPEQRGALNFEAFPMQRELYDEFGMQREGCLMKGTQVGVSCWLIRWAMYWSDIHGLKMMYVFPTRDLMFKFADGRI